MSEFSNTTPIIINTKVSCITREINAELSCNFSEINAKECDGFVIKGINGKDGENGVDGFSPTISVYEDTEESYKLEVQNKDSSFITPNLKGKNGEDGKGTLDLVAGNNINIEDNVISVLTTNNAEQDNTRPITSAGVNTIVGNIDVLLRMI